MASDSSAAPAAKGTHTLLKSLISGGVGGMCLVFVGQPFDMVKVRMQTARAVPGQAAPGAAEIARSIIKAEGARGLYRGMTAPLMGVTPIFAICFWAYELGKETLAGMRGVSSPSQLGLVDVGIAGAFSAVPTTLIMAPGERIKVLLQVQGSGFKGPGDVVKHLVKTEGVASVFRGSAATLLRDGSGSFAYFAVYEYIKRRLSPEGGGLSPLAVILGGGLAGVFNWLVAIPFDTIKSRIQTQTAAAAAGGGSGMLTVARKLIAEEGAGALFRGVGPALLRAFPANAACFMGMEASKAALDKLM